VRLKETGAEGLIALRTLGQEYFHHDEKSHALVGDRSGTKYSLGDTLTVRLMEAAPLTGGLRFELTEHNEPRPKAQVKFRPSRNTRKRR
jgi:ribonuclease R